MHKNHKYLIITEIIFNIHMDYIVYFNEKNYVLFYKRLMNVMNHVL